MEIGKKIRALRVKKGVTQETLAEALLVSSQAVSKWENEQSAPDIQLLPEIAVYFGVTVDELFSLSEEKEYDRIQNMLWDERVVSQSEADRAERWLLGKIKEGWRAADCYVLLADLYNHRAYSMHEQAAEYAKAALAIGEEGGLTQIKDAHGELCDAMDGFIPDWCARNHHKLIDYYRDYLEKHPQDWRAHMWLLDNLIDDNRLAEAEEVLARFEKINATYRPLGYRIQIARRAGRLDEAEALMRRLEEEYGEDHFAVFALGDELAVQARYDEAIAAYRRSFEIEKKPRYVDALISIAHIYEILGRPEKAIEALEEELVILRDEWDTTTGETADHVRREIERLKQ
ncbi:MAG: helix-turn-helix domain-containing protein [Oscillospiraceae bacterium]|nr:helix-turn-helix domain-containing protein [Oscillospiraceae bacterium]